MAGDSISSASCIGQQTLIPASVARITARRIISAPFVCVGQLAKARAFALPLNNIDQPIVECRVRVVKA